MIHLVNVFASDWQSATTSDADPCNWCDACLFHRPLSVYCEVLVYNVLCGLI